MTYLPPDIIDNDQHTLVEALRRTVSDLGQRQLDVATGYFAPDVWRLIGDAFAQLQRMRLLLGERPEVPFGVGATLDLRAYYRRKIADDLAALAFDPAHARLVDGLIAFLERESVAVRLFGGPFLHAKAYVFDRVSYVGSGNFTPAGLTRNSELMLANTQEGTARQLREWFEGKWAESADYKPDLIETLRASKFGSRPYTPHEVFIKALYEYFKDRLTPDFQPGTALDLARFQDEGKHDAFRLLDRWGSVLVADAVGLGKTYIGLSLLERELVHKRVKRRVPRGLLICPAQLRELVWRPRLEEYGIPVVDILSQEEIGRADFDWKRYSNVDVVLVDESHNFRNPDINRYRTLGKIITSGRRKRVILMTATPVNNSLYDLYHQVLLLARGNDRFYRPIGINSLIGYFKAAAGGGIDIFDLLEQTTVRRSRADIRRRQEAGEEIIINGKPIRFPRRQLERVEYRLDGTYKGLYRLIVETIERLHFVCYNLAGYARASTRDTEKDTQRNEALIALMKMLFLKRLESSAAAFETSIERQAQFQRRFLAALQRGRLLDAHNYRKLVAIETDEERPAAVEDLLNALPEVARDAFDMETIASRVQEDISALGAIADLVRQARGQAGASEGDDKLRRIKALLAGPLRGQKALIFTSFFDTAAFLHQHLTGDAAWMAQAGQPEVGVISGETKADERQRLVQRFAPVANAPRRRGGLAAGGRRVAHPHLYRCAG